MEQEHPTGPAPVSVDAAAQIQRLVAQMERVIRGKRTQIELVITALLILQLIKEQSVKSIPEILENIQFVNSYCSKLSC